MEERKTTNDLQQVVKNDNNQKVCECEDWRQIQKERFFDNKTKISDDKENGEVRNFDGKVDKKIENEQDKEVSNKSGEIDNKQIFVDKIKVCDDGQDKIFSDKIDQKIDDDNNEIEKSRQKRVNQGKKVGADKAETSKICDDEQSKKLDDGQDKRIDKKSSSFWIGLFAMILGGIESLLIALNVNFELNILVEAISKVLCVLIFLGVLKKSGNKKNLKEEIKNKLSSKLNKSNKSIKK